MSIQNAINLLKAIDDQPSLRDELYQCSGRDGFRKSLDSKGFKFTMNELDDAINMLHLQCKELEDAQELMHKADWVHFMIAMNEHAEI